tara:strand:+ start:228 stop:419 length:192 start_codon:yes stop_codon:yes gene_type:complete
MAEDGMETEVRELQPWNARASICVTAEGMVMWRREVHPWKASTPIRVTDGRVMDGRELQPLKA